ncbi:hypothetical protein AVEN_218164-1 [Araneus ventricosus]|uniref:Reverse transcriptase domain-containing protein n=1 Tax=Araneus ventricosus TaxID=182803 RepID=A0A4Y2FUI0_ARAVE|nr:hypothetical protein AVEN_218164-1 [Araneus ventricosus]
MVISRDIQGAFDHLQYNSIRNSLDKFNFPSDTIEILKDILTDRTVTFQTTQVPVSWLQQQGCSQGSCTGPMSRNLVANEIISEKQQPNVHLQAFADDFIFMISELAGPKNITEAYYTTPTAALQIIEGIIPFHINAEQEAAYVRIGRLRKTSIYNNINFTPNN